MIIPVIGFNSSKYDLNMVKEYFMKKIRYNKEVNAKKTFYCKEGE